MTPSPAQPPRRSQASLVLLIVLAFLSLGAAVILALSIPEPAVLPDAVPTVTLAADDSSGFACDAVEAKHLIPFGDYIVRLTAGRVECLASDGSEIFACGLDYSTPYAVTGANRLVVADRDGTGYAVFDASGLLFSGNREGRVTGVAIGPGGELALLEDRHDSTGVVAILDAQTGDLQYECHFPESGYVLSAVFTPDGQFLDVALVNTDGSKIRPIFKRFRISGEACGQLVLPDEGLFPLLVYDPAGNLVACSATRLAGLEFGRDTPRFTLDLPHIETVAATRTGLVVLASERVGGKLKLYSLDQNGRLGPGLDVGDSATPLSVLGSRVALGCGTRILVYDAKKSQMILDLNLAAEVNRCGFAGENTLTVVTSTGVRRLNIPS
jgi:hypothetical protein